MKQTINVVTYASYTEADGYIYTDCKVFGSEEAAKDYYDKQCKLAHDECEWGEAFDGDESEKAESFRYETKEERSTSRHAESYEVFSDAYEGYHVKIELVKKKIEDDTRGEE